MKLPLTLYIKGGLGNQLFQFATAYSYSKENNRRVIINTDNYWGYEFIRDAGFVIDQIVTEIELDSPAFWTPLFGKGKTLQKIGKKLL